MRTYEDIIAKPKEVYEIFSDYFGESNVDLQFIPRETFEEMMSSESATEDTIESIDKSFDIIVKFPEVIVTNEYGRSTTIWDLFAKVPIDSDGLMRGKFSLIRSRYNMAQLVGGYMHSHVSHIPKTGKDFVTPCLGSGPILGTISGLSAEFDSDIWNLFCIELDKYVHTESVEGGPHRKLESLSAGDIIPLRSGYSSIKAMYNMGTAVSNIISSFTEWLIKQNIIKFNYIDGRYNLAMSYHDFIVFISNEFIKYYNIMYSSHEPPFSCDELMTMRLLQKAIYSNGRLRERAVSRHRSIQSSYLERIGEVLFEFKGKPVHFEIIDDNDDENMVTILNPEIVCTLARIILNIVNYEQSVISNDLFASKKRIYL